ncbi:MAG: ATP synthase F1 subunit delta [Acidobacteria bacterium]|nr:ATP synthase F1 subunit delta [Acidobacteriota bacterium]
MFSRRQAKEFALALIPLAEERGVGERVVSELLFFSKLIQREEKLRRFLAHPEVISDEKRRIVGELAKKLSFSPISIAFLNLLIRKRRAHQLPLIAEVYAELLDEKRGVARSKVISARRLTKEEREQLCLLLEEGLGKKVKLEAKIDPSLIGGVMVMVRGLLIDGSLRGQLNRIKEKLLRGDISEAERR